MLVKEKITLSDVLTRQDWGVFTLLIVLTLVSILWGEYRKKRAPDQEESFIELLLMGRKLTLPLFVATLVSTWYGGIFGVAQIAFESGIYNFITQGVFWYLTYFIFAYFFVSKVRSYPALTLPNLVHYLFGKRSGFLAALLNILNLVPVVYTIGLGLLTQMIFGWPLEISMLVALIPVTLISMLGGLRAVVYSDVIQFFNMCLAVFVVAFISIREFGLDFLTQNLPPSHFELTGGYSLLQTLSWGLIALSTLVDPNFYQRALAAKDRKTAKHGIYFSILIWIIFDLSLTLGAMYARAVIPKADPALAYMNYALQILPSPLAGFFLAGLFATILSTVDSYLLLAGSTLSYDLAPEGLKGNKKFHFFSVFSIAALSWLLAIGFEGNIKAIWKTMGSLSSASLLIPMCWGLFVQKNITDKTFSIAIITGALGTFVWRLSGLKYTYNLDEIYIGSLCSLLVLVASRLRYAKPAEKN